MCDMMHDVASIFEGLLAHACHAQCKSANLQTLESANPCIADPAQRSPSCGLGLGTCPASRCTKRLR